MCVCETESVSMCVCERERGGREGGGLGKKALHGATVKLDFIV